MLSTTTITLRQSRRKISTIRPVRNAPSAPSVATPHIARVTYGDWSKSKRTLQSGGSDSCMRGRLAFTALTTDSVDASAVFVTMR